MHFSYHLLVPLLAAFMYVVATLLLKRATAFGIGLWRNTFLANWAMGLCFQPMWLMPGVLPDAGWWHPAVTAALFFVGQIFVFLAIQHGDVSVATPVMGIKVIIVALMSSVLLTQPVPLKWWFAAGLSTLSVALLGLGGGGKHRKVGLTLIYATLSMTAFALCDVYVQKWLPAWGPWRFIPVMFGLVALFSFGLMPLFSAPLREIKAEAWRWLGPGLVVLALQAGMTAYSMGVFGDATAVNIVFSSRGLWSVVLVWVVGHWFQNDEQKLPAGVLVRRLVGAILMLSAILVVLM